MQSSYFNVIWERFSYLRFGISFCIFSLHVLTLLNLGSRDTFLPIDKLLLGVSGFNLLIFLYRICQALLFYISTLQAFIYELLHRCKWILYLWLVRPLPTGTMFPNKLPYQSKHTEANIAYLRKEFGKNQFV